MDNDYTLYAALATAIAAILAPTIATVITCIKDCYIAKQNQTIEIKLKLYDEFSRIYSACQYGSEKIGYMQKFYESTTRLIMLCHKRKVRQTLFVLANEVNLHGASKETDVLYEKCVRLLAKEF